MYDAPRGPWMAQVNPGDLSKAGIGGTLKASALQALRDQAERSRADAMARGPPQTPLGRPATGRSDVSSVGPPPRGLAARRKPLTAAPWESMAVQQFAGRLACSTALEAGTAPVAMRLQSANGSTLLAAMGDGDDHRVAGEVVVGLQDSRGGGPPSRAGSAAQSGLVRVPRGQQAPLQKQQVSFGAVYEHRDMAGKPCLVGSTGVLPERQFQLDYQSSSKVQELARHGGPGSSGHLVWVGIGCGGLVGESEMEQVREAIVDARSKRLQLDKLSSEKPYSRHF
eukprot:TRINITY_DN104521_c0_g1_i1.p1 TRINITY_DN104521_c0_g1~~TRINITY_DN104521_c0_g1_i1.p1  ORF type:complete len:282 (-),score=61.45 TRINITY_DN104521_c0_g1_i1:13-858(-)